MPLEEEIKEEYYRRFTFQERKLFRKNSIPKEVAVSYPERHLAEEINELYNRKILPEQANKYDHRFNAADLITLFDANINLDTAFFPLYLSGNGIVALKKAGISPQQAVPYLPRFGGRDIVTLLQASIIPEVALAYPYEYDSGEICALLKLGIGPKMFPPKKIHLLRRIISIVSSNAADFTIIGAGTNGIIFLNERNRSTYKYNTYESEELKLLQKLQQHHGHLENIVNLVKKSPSEFTFRTAASAWRRTKEFMMRLVRYASTGRMWYPIFPADVSQYGFEIEYIHGKSLHQILDLEKKVYPTQKTLQYAADIFNGLIELRASKIYHRDLWLGNILIDKKKDKPVIIDLDSATDDPDEGLPSDPFPKTNPLYLERAWDYLGALIEYFHGKRVFSLSGIWLIDCGDLMDDDHESERLRNGVLTNRYFRKNNIVSCKRYFQERTNLWEEHLQHLAAEKSSLPFRLDGLTHIPEELTTRIFVGRLKYPLDDGNINRRYGGENDLQSLGQIMYKMSTGHHIFNPTIDQSTCLIPEEVKVEREKAYADPATLEKRLQQVREVVKDEKVAEIITYCLQAKGIDADYQMLEERFKSYGN